MRTNLILLFLIITSFSAKAQYSFTGHIDNEQWHNNVYLSVIEDYRKISGVYFEQIIAKVNTDSLGYFKFSSNQLEHENRIYKIHVDNCFDDKQSSNHFNGHCDDSKEIIFIAKNNDTIAFPFSFDEQMFCDIESTNNKKWFKTLQDFGEKLNEPIAELYAYSFLSDRRNDFHKYYLEDLKNNPYYHNLLSRLTKQYPNSPYIKQYKEELASDEFIINKNTSNYSSFNWHYLVYIILIVSVILNFIFWFIHKKHKTKSINKAKEKLTKQEQNILNFLLEDKSNKEIAETAFISLSTVKTHINNIYKKLNVQSRDEIKSLFNK